MSTWLKQLFCWHKFRLLKVEGAGLGAYVAIYRCEKCYRHERRSGDAL